MRSSQEIRDIVFASETALVRVEVLKADMATPTVFEFIPAMTANAVVGASTASGAQSAETRAANNPTLVNVMCSIRAEQAKSKAKKGRLDGWSSFYCDAAHVIAVWRNGVEVYRAG
jgi:hypothetical protein